jgi:excinuclease ABC subunit C
VDNNNFLKNILTKLPDNPGIYLYYDKNKELIYVGKATSLKNRVKSYFNGKRHDRPIEQMIHEVVDIKWKETDSVLEAVIVESLYIKKFLPKYNVLGKDNRSWNYIVITKDEYPRVDVVRQHYLSQISEGELKKKFRNIFGPYPGLNSRATLKVLARIFHISFCKPGSNRPCLYHEMGQCLGVCVRKISPKEYVEKVIRPLIMLLRGEKKRLLQNLRHQMKAAAKVENFEDAALLRNQLLSLEKIHDIAMLNESFFQEKISVDPKVFAAHVGEEKVEVVGEPAVRIEGYDISNLGSTGIVGSMVVFTYGEPDKKQYRKFRIKSVAGQSDVDSLTEMLDRRLRHVEWPLPALFLIDGGRPQINAAKKVLQKNNVHLPIVGIAKGPERKRNDFFISFEPASESNEQNFREMVKWVNDNKNLLIRVRDEAHRFAIRFQRATRKIS